MENNKEEEQQMGQNRRSRRSQSNNRSKRIRWTDSIKYVSENDSLEGIDITS